MSPGFQTPGAPSYASSLRGGPAAYRPNRVGRPRGNPSPVVSIPFQNKSKAENHPPSTPSNLGPYSQAHNRTQRSVATDPRVPRKVYFDDDSAATSQTTRQANPTVNEGVTTSPKPTALDQQGIVDSMTRLSVDCTQKPEPVVMGRSLNWERPKVTPSTSSHMSKCLPRSDRSYPKPATSEYSISYKRAPDQVPMEQAGFREYAPFLKSEFKIGTIVRRNVHEPDYLGPAMPAFAPGSQASQASTLVGRGGKDSKQHRSDGDFGPIYSEDRYFIVVSLGKQTYYAIPLYTHGKKGLANIAEKEDWISVQDHRQPESCRQQSGHWPLCTTFMNPETRILDPVTAAWLPYAVPIRYSVPVAYQGKLDKDSAKRVRNLFLEHLGGEIY